MVSRLDIEMDTEVSAGMIAVTMTGEIMIVIAMMDGEGIDAGKFEQVL
jgi:hypothetical protein